MKKTAVKIIFSLFFFSFFLIPRECFSESAIVTEAGGYYKNLLTFTKSIYTDEGIFADLSRLRVELQAQAKAWIFYAAVDNEFLVNDFANTADFAFTRSQQQQNLAFADLDKVSVDNDHLYARHSLYRAYLKYYSPSLQLVIGKQSIDWGKMRFYSPVDLFNSLAPSALEPDERVGVDALNLNLAGSDFSGINIVVSPGTDSGEASFGVKLYNKMATYDCSLIAASIKKDIAVGVALDGYAKDAGLRAEITHNRHDNGRDFARIAVGVDYNFPNKLYILFEQFYNGGFEDNDASAFSSSYDKSRRILSLKKHLSNLYLSYELTPLLKLSNMFTYDWEGKSVFLAPLIKYNIVENCDISAGLELFYGRANSEFGDYKHLYYFELKRYF
ncbi:MAG: hypothetical protein COV72_02830 [Candidatus Omnitrophica bacterium CG11_big_fil_rev_8_21_14_0_20_42_13]|uniref:Alginate export domain-containing protein n=1 Tax=Candidatus Ghiorseimicrobium undicola TaxID=1974746 RepID=A0A2H0LYJ6_9BACT|nr:MAG: hypothetical protein COV72_02830 [Candidatus Omnitrophica bacterium CG11_big_fil_rev_8_21_14_0_20_42_13]